MIFIVSPICSILVVFLLLIKSPMAYLIRYQSDNVHRQSILTQLLSARSQDSGPGSWLSWSASDSVQLYRQPEPGAAAEQLTAVCNIRTHSSQWEGSFLMPSMAPAWDWDRKSELNQKIHQQKLFYNPSCVNPAPSKWSEDPNKTFSKLVIWLTWPRNRL